MYSYYRYNSSIIVQYYIAVRRNIFDSNIILKQRTVFSGLPKPFFFLIFRDEHIEEEGVARSRTGGWPVRGQP